MHTSISGVADSLARTDEEGISMMRELVGDLVKPSAEHVFVVPLYRHFFAQSRLIPLLEISASQRTLTTTPRSQ